MSVGRRIRIGREILRLSAAVLFERLTTGLVFNPLAPDWRLDPYERFRELREKDPIHRSYAVRGWVLLRHADCLELLRDDRFSADDRNFVGYPARRAAAIADGLIDPDQPNEPSMLRRDPPDHTRLRSLVNKAFTPRAVERLHSRVEELTDELLTGLAQRGGFDLIEDFAVPLPVTIIAEMLGIPARDFKQFKKWSDDLVGFLDPQASPGPRVLRRTVDELSAYIDSIAEQRRAQPADDLLSALVVAEEAGDRLSAQELQTTVALLLAAGNETTTNLIGNGVLALLRNPTELDRLRSEPELAVSAVEELLRWNSPVQFTMRVPRHDIDFHGVRFRKGQAVVAALASANRDPDVFEHPDRLDIGRQDNKHISFGFGAHFCLGAQLARLEGQVAIPEIIRRFPDLRLDTDEVRWRRLTFLRGLEGLPLRV